MLDIENPVAGDGFIYDGVKFIKVAPSMETYALIAREKQIDKLVRALEEIEKHTEGYMFPSGGIAHTLGQIARAALREAKGE